MSKYEDGTNEHDYELNQFENAAEYVKQGHSLSVAAITYGLDVGLLAKFIEVNQK